MTPDFEDKERGVQLFLGDCLTILPHLSGIDAVICDPPYNFESRGGGLYSTHHHLDSIRNGFGTDFDPKPLLTSLLPLFGKNLLVWFSNKLLPCYLNWAIENELNWDLMFWHKINAMPNYGGKLMSDTEICLRAFHAGESFVQDGLGYESYRKFHIDTVQPSNGHPTPKPINLMIKQVKLFCPEKSIVCDPTMGSGTTGIACLRTGRKFIGIEIDPHYFQVAKERIQRELAQGVLL